jgi:hypothetical protein
MALCHLFDRKHMANYWGHDKGSVPVVIGHVTIEKPLIKMDGTWRD